MASMRAMVRHAYGPPALLRMERVPRPEPRDREVLVRVRAASLNLGDWELMTGRPRYVSVFARLFSGRPPVRPAAPEGATRSFPQPKFKILGCDYAGIVESVGRSVTGLAPGDEVLGLSMFGSCAEFVCVPESAPIVRKPAGLPFEAAAALPQAAFLAVQGIRDRGAVRPGQKVVVVGAGGGAGTLAVQIAKHLGAEVTAVDRGFKADLLRSIGANHVVDYRREDFLENGRTYDLVFDLVAHRSVLQCRRSLNPGGLYLVAGGTLLPFLQALILGPAISRFGRGRIGYLMAASPRENLEVLLGWIELGKVRPILDRTFPLSELPAALLRVGEGRALGKVVLTVAPADDENEDDRASRRDQPPAA